MAVDGRLLGIDQRRRRPVIQVILIAPAVGDEGVLISVLPESSG